MTTLAQLRAQVRAELDDTSGSPLWPDERLNAWVREAIRGYGRFLPREATLSLSSVAGQAGYVLPPEVVAVLGVEHPDGAARAPGGWPGFQVFGEELTLMPPPTADGQMIRLRCAAMFAEPGADGDTLATPSTDDDLLVMAVAARALRWLSAEEGKSPPAVRPSTYSGSAALALAADYERTLAAALARRARKFGPSRRLRQG